MFFFFSQIQWGKSVIPVAWEAEAGNCKFKAILGNLVEHCLKIKRGVGMELDGRALPNMPETLGSTPGTAKSKN